MRKVLMMNKKNRKGDPHTQTSESDRDALFAGYLNPELHENLRRLEIVRKKRKHEP